MADALKSALGAIDGNSAPTVRALKNLVRSIKRGDVPQERHRLEFKRSFSDDTRGWVELIKDIVALANFGGGLILFGIDNDAHCLGLAGDLSRAFDPANISNKIRRYSSQGSDQHFIYPSRILHQILWIFDSIPGIETVRL